MRRRGSLYNNGSVNIRLLLAITVATNVILTLYALTLIVVVVFGMPNCTFMLYSSTSLGLHIRNLRFVSTTSVIVYEDAKKMCNAADNPKRPAFSVFDRLGRAMASHPALHNAVASMSANSNDMKSTIPLIQKCYRDLDDITDKADTDNVRKLTKLINAIPQVLASSAYMLEWVVPSCVVRVNVGTWCAVCACSYMIERTNVAPYPGVRLCAHGYVAALRTNCVHCTRTRARASVNVIALRT